MYSDILIPVDGSSFSEHAIPYAGAIARRASGRLRVVLVHIPLTTMAADLTPTAAIQQLEGEHRQAEARYLDELVERLKGRGLDVQVETLEGEVAPALVERAKAVDLLVMTTHGRTGLARAWLGSVAEEVIHHVHRPVLLVRPRDEEQLAEEPRFEHVLVGTDGSAAAEAATEEALEVARMFEAKLTLVRVVTMPAGLTSPYIPHAAQLDRETRERREEEARGYLSRAAEQLADGLEMETRVEVAYHPARGILDAADEVGCDLIVVGTHRSTRLARVVLGSVADKVLRAATVPVLVAHADG